MMAGARQKALKVLGAVVGEGAYSNLALKAVLEGAGQSEASWVAAAVYTTLDNLTYLDYIIGHYANGKFRPVVRNVLRLGVCQLLFMNVPPAAACNESVKLVKQVGKGALAGYVNGVMRAICRDVEAGSLPELPRDPVKRLSVRHGYPEFITREYIGRNGEAFAQELMEAPQLGMVVRAQHPCTTYQLAAELCALGVETEPGRLAAGALRLKNGINPLELAPFKEGRMSVQSESSMLVCNLVAPKPGMDILDACAAPGGKSAYMASLAENGCNITAWELHGHRAELVHATFKRLGVSCARVEVCDAAVFRQEYATSMDAVLVDAPCSGFGVTGKPDVRLNKTEQKVLQLAELQSKILDSCAGYVKPGGVLVYSTCTISERENQQQAEAFLARHTEFTGDDIAHRLPSGLRARVEGCGIQLYPHIDRTEGFYMALFKRCV